MTEVISPARPRRNIELVLLLAALAIALGADLLGMIGTDAPLDSTAWVPLGVFGAATLVLHVVLRLRAPYADPFMLPITALLNGLGLAMIHRLSQDAAMANPTSQLVWSVLAVLVASALVFLVRDHRVLRRWPYLFLAASGVLLLLPLVPGLGLSMYGARIWIDVGFGTFQPGEIAKITLAIFFAGYLSANRDLILLAGRRVLITAGPTFEPIDPVRFLGNRSSGRQGAELALAAADRGADVTLVAAHVDDGVLTAVARPYIWPFSITAPYGSCDQPSPGGTTSPWAFSAIVRPPSPKRRRTIRLVMLSMPYACTSAVGTECFSASKPTL